MQIKVEKGRGYVPGNVRRYGDETTKTIGRIVLDASFSPVRRVSYTVESARVEQRTDLDKLVLEIESNGVISAEDAVRDAARILMEQLAVFAQLDGNFLDGAASAGGVVSAGSVVAGWFEQLRKIRNAASNANSGNNHFHMPPLDFTGSRVGVVVVVRTTVSRSRFEAAAVAAAPAPTAPTVAAAV